MTDSKSLTIDLNDIRQPIDKFLKYQGFRSKSNKVWDRRADKIIQVTHLDRSSYGAQYRIEVLFGLDEFVSQPSYKLSDFDTVLRFNRVVDRASDLYAALDQERIELAADIRREIISWFLNEQMKPLLDMARDVKGLSKLREKFPSLNDFYVGRKMAKAISGYI